MTVNRADLNLSRFRYTAPAWWTAFERGREAQRREAVNESSGRDEWRRADWSRKALEKAPQ